MKDNLTHTIVNDMRMERALVLISELKMTWLAEYGT